MENNLRICPLGIIQTKFDGNPTIRLRYLVMDLGSAKYEVRGVVKIIKWHGLGNVSLPDFTAIWLVRGEFSCSLLKCWTDRPTN